MKKIVFTIFLSISIFKLYSQNILEAKFPKSLASYKDFKTLMIEVENHREARLINLNSFMKMSENKNVVILDSRSKFRYDRKHLKNSIHLGFSDFTQDNLWELIPDQNTTVLIYCNNNFIGDQINFASKISKPNQKPSRIETQILSNRKPMMLALNIPTFINLYGYGYKNVYELNELVNVNDSRIEFEGTEVSN